MEKKFIEDKQGNKVLPITHVSAVLDDSGNDIGSVMGAFEDEVRGLVDTPHQNYVTVATYASLPASGSEDTIYRVSNYDGSTSQVDVTSYSEYAWNGSSYTFLCKKSQIGEVFDITVYNSNTKYADLSAALGTNGANVPQELRKGGMSVKYVSSSDNKYVQARYMLEYINNADGIEHFVDVRNWIIVGDEKTKYLSNDYNCFRGYVNSSYDFNFADGGTLHGIYSAFLSLKLINVTSGLYAIQNIARNISDIYFRLIFKRWDGTSWNNNAYTFLATMDIETNPNGINIVDITLQGGERMVAVIDFSLLGAISLGHTINNPVYWVVKEDCIYPNGLPDDNITSINNHLNRIDGDLETVINDSDLTVETISNNIANPANITLNKGIANNGAIKNLTDWAMIMIPVSLGDVITAGGFTLGRRGYYAFYNDDTLVSFDTFSDPQGTTTPLTVTAPSGCNRLYIDIATDDHTPAYDLVRANIGNSLLPYEVYKEVITKINSIPLVGEGSREGMSTIVMDLPVSNGTDIQSGYAYIDSTDRSIKVKA